MITFQYVCTCGKREERIETKLAAEVAADRHEAQFTARRAYAHDTTILQEAA